MKLAVVSKTDTAQVSYRPGRSFLGSQPEADWLNANARPAIEKTSLGVYLNSRQNKEAPYRLTLLPFPEVGADVRVLGVSAMQQRVYGYDGLYWSAPAQVEPYDPDTYPSNGSEYRPTRVTRTLPKYTMLSAWELFVGSLERHLPSDLVTVSELPEPVLGRM